MKKIKKTTLAIGMTAGLLTGTLNTSCAQLTSALVNNQIIEQNTDHTVTNLDEPYTKLIGNGNYFVHNFIGKNTTINKKDVYDSTSQYLGKGEVFIKGLCNEFEQTFNDRDDVSNYFRNFVDVISSLNFKLYKDNPGNVNIDRTIDYISSFAQNHITDLVKNLDTDEQRKAFKIAYRVLANEAYKEGFSNKNEDIWLEMDKYKTEKKLLIAMAKNNTFFKLANVNLEKEYDYDNFTGTTNILDDLIVISVNNMKTNKYTYRYDRRYPKNMQPTDSQRHINITLTNNSLEALHDQVAKNLGHKDQCDLRQKINTAIDIAVEEAYYNDQKRLQANQELNK